jgi:hypothetical protein
MSRDYGNNVISSEADVFHYIPVAYERPDGTGAFYAPTFGPARR